MCVSESQELIQEYAGRAEQYGIPELTDGSGFVMDQENGMVLVIGIAVYRETYQKCGFFCREDTSEKLKACVCALFELVQDMPVIKIRLLSPEQVLEKLGCREKADYELERYAAMAIAGLNQAFGDYMRKR